MADRRRDRGGDRRDDRRHQDPGRLAWIDIRGPNGNIPESLLTQMPGNPNNTYSPGYPFSTYYLRTHFTFTNSLSGVSLLFADFIDDGAIFYLNGTEIYRLRMPAPPTPVYNATLASGYACGGDATCPDSFTISGDLTTNLFVGDNVLAAEVHNYSLGSPDITFGTALLFTEPYPLSPQSVFFEWYCDPELDSWRLYPSASWKADGPVDQHTWSCHHKPIHSPHDRSGTLLSIDQIEHGRSDATQLPDLGDTVRAGAQPYLKT